MSIRAGGTDYRRMAGLAGVVSAILLTLGLILTFAQGAPPALDGSSEDIAQYFADNEGLGRIAGLFSFLPILTVPVFFIGWYLLNRGEGTSSAGATATGAWARVALLSLIVLGVLSTIQGSAALAIVMGVKDEFGGQPAIAGALFDLYNAVGAGSALAMALLLWSVAQCHRDGRDGSPSWLPMALLVGAVAALLSFLAPFTELDALAFAGLLAFIVFIVWIAVAGLGLLRSAGGVPMTDTTRGGTA